MSSPTNTFDIDLDDERSRASSDVLGSSAALQIRQLERERRLREIERTFQNVVSEAESQEGKIYENVFTERGEVHNEVNIRNKEYEIEQSRPKSVAGKLKERAINQVNRIKKKDEAFDFEVQSKTAAGNFDDYIPDSDFSSHKQHMNRPSSPNHARMVYTLAVSARRHSSKIAIALLIFITAIATTVTLTALKEAPIPMTLSEETWENLKAIRAALIDQGIPKGPLMEYDSRQFAAVTQLAEEVDLGELSIGSIVDKTKPVVAINSEGLPANFNNAYKERRIVLERYVVMTLYLTTSTGKEWRKKENWMKNNVNICKGWHGIECKELAGDEITMEVVSTLHLPSNEIHGEIPVELSFLQQLESLNLSNNFLVGTVPASLGEIKSLKQVELSRNLFTGRIPSSFCTLKTDFVLEELVSDCGGDFTCSCCTECL